MAEEQQFTPDLASVERLLENSAETLGLDKSVVSQAVKNQDELSRKIIESSIHLRAVEYVMARAHFEVLD